MATTSLVIKYRPARIGFLIRRGSVDDYLTAVRTNTLLWGGKFNPCLPVCGNDTRWADELLQLFPVDFLYAVADAPELNAFKERHPFLTQTHRHVDSIFEQDWRSKKSEPQFLDIKDIVDRYWSKEFRHKPEGFASNFVLPKWQVSDPLHPLFATLLGQFPTPDEAKALRYDYEQVYVRGLKASALVLAEGGELPAEVVDHITPMTSTTLDLIGYGSTGPGSSDGVYVGKAGDVDDLVRFWNLRACGFALSFLATDALDRTKAAVQADVDRLDSMPDSHPNIPDHITFYAHITDEAHATSILEPITTKKRKAIARMYDDTAWVRPGYQVFNWEQTIADVEHAYDRYTVAVRLPEKKFLEHGDMPLGGRRTLAASVEALSEFAHPGFTLKLPFLRELNEFYGREVCSDPWRLKADREGLRVLIDGRDSHLDLRPIAHRELLEKMFALAAIKANRSQPGLIATRILERIDGIDGGRVFKLKSVRKLLQELKPHESVTRGDATRIIFENEFTRHKGLYIERREKQDLDPQDVFDFLLKKGFFRAGLELECDHCKLGNWLSLKQLDDQWTCEYCGDDNRTSLHLRSRGDWKFRKSGLFAKDNNQEGAIPVLLTLLVFVRVLRFPGFLYSTAIKLDGDGIDCESDFSVVQYEHGDAIEVVIGECKSEGGRVDAEDCGKLKVVYQRLAQKGWQPYIAFGKTAENFEPEEISLFQQLRADGIAVILFTNNELEPYHPYWEKEAEGLPHKHAVSLRDLVENSTARYLGLVTPGSG